MQPDKEMSDAEFKIANKEWSKREFPKRLMKTAMEYHGYTPNDKTGVNVDIAKKCNVDKSMVTRWMKGVMPRASTIMRIAEAYGVSPDYLVGNDDAPEGGFSVSELESHIPEEALLNVMRIMYEAQNDIDPKPSKERFAEASLAVLKLVEREPRMPEYAISGAATHALKRGPEALSDADTAVKL